VSTITAWLSEKSVVGVLIGLKTSERGLQSHKPSLPPCVTVTYLLSMMERDMISWYLKDQDTALPLMRNA
jgi:hypothetical protein